MRSMTLDEWMTRQGYSSSELARQLGVNVSMVSRWRNGLAIPDGENMIRIWQLSAGEVDPNSFYDLQKA